MLRCRSVSFWPRKDESEIALASAGEPGSPTALWPSTQLHWTAFGGCCSHAVVVDSRTFVLLVSVGGMTAH